MDKKDKNYLDIDEIKPRKWLMVILIIIALVIIVILLNKVVITIQEKHNDNKEKAQGIFELFKNGFDSESLEDEIDNFDIDFKNASFESYSGTQMAYSTKELLDEIIKNNKKSDNLIEVTYKETKTTNPDEIKNLKSNFSNGNKYEISINYDDKGLVNSVVIEDVDVEADDFNFMLKHNNGSNMGASVTHLLDEINTSNKEHQNHLISVSLNNSTLTSDENAIIAIKAQIDTWANYEVILDYDANGYIYQARITKK